MKDMASSQPMVTVIIPVYNTEQYLEECLGSLRDQTMKEWEAICIDDGSSDGSLQILLRWAEADGRIRVLSNPGNRRPAYSRNRGLEQAKGRYIYFLDSDDRIVPEALEELAALAEKEELEGVLFDTRPVFESERLRAMYANAPYYRRRHTYDRVMTGEEFFWLTASRNEFSCALWMQFWRREFLERNRIRFYEGLPHTEDQLFTVEAFTLAKRVRHVGKTYHIYRRREGALTSPAKENRAQDFWAWFTIDCESLHFLAEHAGELSPKYRQYYHLMYAVQQYQQLQARYSRLAEPGKMGFRNPVHEILYRRFARNEDLRLGFLGLLQKKRVAGFCDRRWQKLLREDYGMEMPSLVCIEAEENRLDMKLALQRADKETFQLYFTGGYDQIRPILMGAGYRERRDFMDGRGLL